MVVHSILISYFSDPIRILIFSGQRHNSVKKLHFPACLQLLWPSSGQWDKKKRPPGGSRKVWYLYTCAKGSSFSLLDLSTCLIAGSLWSCNEHTAGNHMQKIAEQKAGRVVTLVRLFLCTGTYNAGSWVIMKCALQDDKSPWQHNALPRKV